MAGTPAKRMHRRVAAVLPWYVNGTLGADQVPEVERHLAECDDCRSVVEDERVVARALAGRRPLPVAPHDAQFAALMRRIDATEASAPRRWMDGPVSRLEALWHRWWTTSRAVRLVLVTQAVAIMALGTVLAIDWSQRHSPRFETMAAPDDAASSQIEAPYPGWLHLRVVFAEWLEAGQIEKLVAELGGVIVEGPSALGVYTVSLPLAEEDDATERLLQLRDREEVRFVEPLQPVHPRSAP